MPKQKKTKRSSAAVLICSGCGGENEPSADSCKNCGSSRFEPGWVLAKVPITRQTSAQVTKSNPQFGTEQTRVTLSKWWPGGRATFHINTPGAWEEIKKAVDTKLAPFIGWASAQEIIKSISAEQSKAKKASHVGKLLSTHPGVLKEIVTHIDPKKLSASDFESLTETLGQIGDVVTNANAGFREAFLSVVKKLPAQPQRALEDLDLLLKGWNLNVITNVAQQVRARLETIALFEERIGDERTLEIKGENSIHRILERSMWLIDERYWLLHSNDTLRKIIGDELGKKDKELHGDKRPDFVCGTVGERLVILELKRPSHKLTIDDLNQLETYVAIAEKHKTFASISAFLVGNSVSDDLKQRLKYRSNAFRVLFYSDIIDHTKKRYHEYLKSVGS